MPNCRASSVFWTVFSLYSIVSTILIFFYRNRNWRNYTRRCLRSKLRRKPFFCVPVTIRHYSRRVHNRKNYHIMLICDHLDVDDLPLTETLLLLLRPFERKRESNTSNKFKTDTTPIFFSPDPDHWPSCAKNPSCCVVNPRNLYHLARVHVDTHSDLRRHFILFKMSLNDQSTLLPLVTLLRCTVIG